MPLVYKLVLAGLAVIVTCMALLVAHVIRGGMDPGISFSVLEEAKEKKPEGKEDL